MRLTCLAVGLSVSICCYLPRCGSHCGFHLVLVALRGSPLIAVDVGCCNAEPGSHDCSSKHTASTSKHTCSIQPLQPTQCSRAEQQLHHQTCQPAASRGKISRAKSSRGKSSRGKRVDRHHQARETGWCGCAGRSSWSCPDAAGVCTHALLLVFLSVCLSASRFVPLMLILSVILSLLSPEHRSSLSQGFTSHVKMSDKVSASVRLRFRKRCTDQFKCLLLTSSRGRLTVSQSCCRIATIQSTQVVHACLM